MGFLGGGFFGSGAKSSETSTTTQNSGFSEVAGAATSFNVTGGGKNSSQVFNVLDAGAVQGSLSLASLVASQSLNQVELAGGRASAQISAALDAVSANARSDSENFGQQAIKWGAIVAVVIVIAWAASKARG